MGSRSLLGVMLVTMTSVWLIHGLANRHTLLPQTVSEEPVQELVSEPAPWTVGGYQIKPLARYDIHARVIHRESYRWDREADLSPLDFAVGWGLMSDPRIYPEAHVHQSGRWYFWHYSAMLSRDDIIDHSANMHLIPASKEIKSELEDIQANDLVRLTGYLVTVSAKDGYTWTSSLSRTDTGAHSCELMWVETVARDQ